MKGVLETRNKIRFMVENGHLDKSITLLKEAVLLLEGYQINSITNEIITISGNLHRIKMGERLFSENQEKLDIRYNRIAQQVLSVIDKITELAIQNANGSKKRDSFFRKIASE